MKWLLSFFLFVAFGANAQWKSYRLTNNNRDTINCIDEQDRKQGRWVIKVESLRGEPGYEEEGIFKDNKKEGIWRAYTSMGDLYAIERFRWGNKDGKCQYYNITGLQREESWKAVNPENPWDTVDVYDPIDPTKVHRQRIKIEGTSVKHGPWRFYESGSGSLIRSENYFLGKLEVPKPKATAGANGEGEVAEAKPEKAPAKVKPQQVIDFEKKGGKKKYRDGATGM
jgi:hypothetical protein